MQSHPLRALLAAVAMTTAVATTAIVQTALNGLAQSARDASARAFGSDAFVLAKYAAGNLSRRELADKIERNQDITRADVRFLESAVGDRVLLAATVQRSGDVTAGGRKFENAAINGTQATLFDIRDVGIDIGRPFATSSTPCCRPCRRLERRCGSEIAVSESSAFRQHKARPAEHRSIDTCGCRCRHSSAPSAMCGRCRYLPKPPT
jgi:hypothetical protein